jgi:hypothetical protein
VLHPTPIDCSSPALPDDGFLRQICKILADLKVISRAKNISGGLPISGGFLEDLTNFVWVCFCLVDLVGLEPLLAKNNLILTFFCIKKIIDLKKYI